nr:DUF6198 family protein [uncultured Cohaesibacter sp.]
MHNKINFQNVPLFIIGLFLMALGISLSVKADLGVTPISCIPFVYSQYLPLSLGQLTIAMNCIFLLMQILILGRKFPPFQLTQVLAVSILGYFIDFSLYLVQDINPVSYPSQIAYFLASCLIMSFGIYLVVTMHVTYIPGDGLILAIANTFEKNFGKTKIGFDSSMVLIGILSSFLLIHKLVGIREGTIIAALLVGYFVQLYSKLAQSTVKHIRILFQD